MADDNSQEDADDAPVGKSPFQKAYSQAQVAEREAQETDESSQNNNEGAKSNESDEEPSAQDVKEGESSLSDETSENGSEPQSTDEPVDEADSGETEEEDKGPIPYDRFQEVVQDKNQWKERASQLQQEVDAYLNTEEGQQELLQYLKQEGTVEIPKSTEKSAEDDDVSVEESIDTLENFLTRDQIDALRDMIRKEAGVSQSENQSDEDQPQDGPSQVKVQNHTRQLQSKLEEMQESDEFEHFEELAASPYEEGAGSTTWMDVVVEQNPEKFLNPEVGMPQPEDLELIYDLALSRSGVLSSENNAQKEELKKEVRKEVESELQDAKDDEPVSPSGGSPDVDEQSDGAISLRDAIREASEETGFVAS